MTRPAPGASLAVVALLLAAATVGAATITGTAGNDTLRGSPTADRLTGKAGDDRLYGAAGNDVDALVRLIAADVSRAKRAAVIDEHAAIYILQGALDRLGKLTA